MAAILHVEVFIDFQNKNFAFFCYQKIKSVNFKIVAVFVRKLAQNFFENIFQFLLNIFKINMIFVKQFFNFVFKQSPEFLVRIQVRQKIITRRKTAAELFSRESAKTEFDLKIHWAAGIQNQITPEIHFEIFIQQLISNDFLDRPRRFVFHFSARNSRFKNSLQLFNV